MLLMNSMSASLELDAVPAEFPRSAGPVSEPPCRLATLDVGVLEGLRRLERRLDKSVLPGMFDILKRHLPRSCAQLWQALDEDDATAMRQIAHKLKSSARCLGLPRLGEICAQLEKDARAGRLRGAERQLAAIEIEYDRAFSALQQFLVASEPAPATRLSA